MTYTATPAQIALIVKLQIEGINATIEHHNSEQTNTSTEDEAIQAKVLATLVRLRDETEAYVAKMNYSKREASARIDSLISVNRTVRQATAEMKAKAKPAPSLARPAEGIEDGIYRKGESIIKVVHAVHGSGNQYGKVLVVSTHSDGTSTGKFEYRAGLLRGLTPADRLTLEQAVEFGQLYGMCCVCSRTLTNEESIEAGIGPICGGKIAA